MASEARFVTQVFRSRSRGAVYKKKKNDYVHTFECNTKKGPACPLLKVGAGKKIAIKTPTLARRCREGHSTYPDDTAARRGEEV